MKYALEIPQHNVKAHLDIERDIQTKRNGLFTFNLRVNRGDIEDYSRFETVTIDSYQGIAFTVIEELSITFDPGSGSSQNAVRSTNGQRSAEGRGSHS